MGEERLMKELHCVRKIFQGSDDLKGKELHVKADVVHTKLVPKIISPSDACSFIFQFFSAHEKCLPRLQYAGGNVDKW